MQKSPPAAARINPPLLDALTITRAESRESALTDFSQALSQNQ
jgi:hypothetical protein